MKDIDHDILTLISKSSTVVCFYWRCNVDLTLTYVSENIFNFWGYRHDLVLNGAITFESIIHNDDLFNYQLELDLAHGNTDLDEIVHKPFRIKTALGDIRWVQQKTQIQRDETRHAVAYLGLSQDISAQFVAQEQLKESHSRHTLTMLTSGTGTWELNCDTQQVKCDESWGWLVGINKDISLVSVSRIFAMVHGDDIHHFRAALDDYIKGHLNEFTMTTRFKHIDGSWRYLLSKGIILQRNVDGQALKLIVAQSDITQSKEAELQAIDALGSRNHFFARVSHEIRTPMHGILGILSLLKEKLNDDYAVGQINKVIHSSEHLLSLLNDILDLSKLNETQLTIRTEICSISECMIKVEQLFADKAREKNIELRVELPDSNDDLVNVDKVRIHQVLNNLVSNAIKFTDSGEVLITVINEDDRIILAVKDSGVGIVDTASVFDAYKQEPSENVDQTKGTGLGLEIVKKLCDLMAIEISVNSDDSGTTFELDLGRRANTVMFDTTIDTSARKPHIDLHALTVLVVDDSDINREIAQSITEALGIKTLTAASGREAIEVVLTHASPIDVILMDKHMPNINGIEATRHIMGMTDICHTPVIVALTADAFEVDNQEWFDCGLFDLVTKPFTADMLKNVIESAVLSKLSRTKK